MAVTRRKHQGWALFDLAERPMLRKVRGVYALYELGRLVYIGRSVSVGDRIGDHAKRFRFSAIKVAVTHNAHDGRTIERRLLHRLKPPHNRQLPSCRGVSVGMYRSWR